MGSWISSKGMTAPGTRRVGQPTEWASVAGQRGVARRTATVILRKKPLIIESLGLSGLERLNTLILLEQTSLCTSRYGGHYSPYVCWREVKCDEHSMDG